jgi:hypothetical protein
VTSDERVSRHEAAHAVGSFRGGFSPCELRLERTHDTLGAERSADGYDDEETARAYLTALLAGYAVDLRGGVPEEDARCGAETDLYLAEPIIKGLGITESDAVRAALSFVDDPRNRAAIDALAADLLANRKLSGDEVELIILASDGDPDADVTAFRAAFLKGVTP